MKKLAVLLMQDARRHAAAAAAAGVIFLFTKHQSITNELTQYWVQTTNCPASIPLKESRTRERGQCNSP